MQCYVREKTAEEILEILFKERMHGEGRLIYLVDYASTFHLYVGIDKYEEFQKNPFVFFQIKQMILMETVDFDDDIDFTQRVLISINNFSDEDIAKIEELIEKILKKEIEFEKDEWKNIKEI